MYIRIHGRGGQGSFVCAQILAIAAFEEGFYPYASLFIRGGGDRRGAPVTAFAVIEKDKVKERPKRIMSADLIAVQDPSLFEVEDVLSGLSENGTVIINSEKDPDHFTELTGLRRARFKTINATQIALEVLKSTVTSTAMAGAVAPLLDFSFNSVKKAIRDILPEDIAEKNVKAARKAYKYIKRCRT